MKQETNLIRLLWIAMQLAANYDSWKNEQGVQEALNIETNDMCKYIKFCHPGLDSISVRSIALAFCLILFEEITKLDTCYSLYM